MDKGIIEAAQAVLDAHSGVHDPETLDYCIAELREIVEAFSVEQLEVRIAKALAKHHGLPDGDWPRQLFEMTSRTVAAELLELPVYHKATPRCDHPQEYRVVGGTNDWCGKCGFFPIPKADADAEAEAEREGWRPA